MKNKTGIVFLLAILAVAAVIGIRLLRSPGKIPSEVASTRSEQRPGAGGLDSLRGAEVSWPLLFIPNRGQLDPRVAFYLQGSDKNIYFSPDGLTITISMLKEKTEVSSGAGKGGSGKPGLPARLTGSAVGPNQVAGPEAEFRRWSVKLDFVGANPETVIRPLKPTETRMSYFRGGPDDWFAALPTYNLIRYQKLWPGIDLYLKGNPGQLKCEFVVSPGADPSVIRMNYRGATEVRLNEKGQLEVVTPAGSFIDEAPVAFQHRDGRKVPVEVKFEILEKRVGENGLVNCLYGFKTGDYDRTLPLYIDPAVLVYSGFIGGSYNDRALAMAVDANGYVYLTGWTGSLDFPVGVGPDLTYNGPSLGTDAFVAKVHPSGSGLVYCGFLGGSNDDGGTGIAVDSSGQAYVCGYTKSADFPVYGGPYTTPSANLSLYSDAFITRINAAGTALVYSGYLGGSSTDLANSVAVDSSGRAYVCGTTESTDFPAKTGPDTSHNGQKDAFVCRVAATGASLDWSGFIGGTADDVGSWLALDAGGNVYLAGYTASTQGQLFPVKNGPYLNHKGGLDAFVAKIASAGNSIIYCGYIGGTGDDYGSGLAVSAGGEAFITGATNSQSGFPLTVGPDLTYNGGMDVFISRVNQAGTGLIYSGYVGGSLDDFGLAVAVDSQGIAYLGGATDSYDFPAVGGPQSAFGGSRDAFLLAVKNDGSGYYISSFLGGSDREEANGVAALGDGNCYLAGFTRSWNFPVLVGPFLQPGGGVGQLAEDAFVARVYGLIPPLAPVNLRLTSVTVSSASLAWDDKSSNEDGFKIERKTGATGTWSQIANVGANVNTFQNTGLSEATTYYYRVRAYNSAGDSAYSNELNVLTLPAAPTNLVATAVHERRVNLSWTDSSGGESGFRLERKTGGGNWNTLANLAANVTSYPDTSVVESTTYTYRIFAFNGSGDSAASNEATVVTPDLTIPLAPSDLQATALSASSVRLNWVDNAYNEDGFKIERKTGAAGTWVQVGTVGLDATSFTDTGLSGLTTYYYRVRAYNNAGDSGYSNEAAVTTPENRPIIRVPVSGISFGNVNVCESRDMTTTIYNDGGADLLVSAVSRTSGSTDFSYKSPVLPLAVPPFGSRTITVSYAPSATGPASAVFRISSNDPDNPAVDFSASGSGYIPVITIGLEVQKGTERAWIIKRDFSRITITVNKQAPYTVARYRLWRKVAGGSFELRKDFIESDFSYGRLVYVDKYLDKNKSYVYKLEALNCYDQVIAVSSETGTTGSSLKEEIVRRLDRTVKD
ncbi:MAG: fibronectin type III domain-containing protein [Candidatus Saccharicenans sp.]|nr:fibronectin type III domain-containing protein [Candidatus Saccharicenans sp.]